MRVILMMVTKNEASRYLDASLDWNKQFADEVCVFDDNSTDETVQVALKHGCSVAVADAVSFMEHEGRFREAAWRWMESAVTPEEGDWILCLDADEFLVHKNYEIKSEIEQAESGEFDGIVCEIPEIFGTSEYTLYRRIDGFWGSIRGMRLVKWKPDGYFLDREMGCGSTPTNIKSPRVAEDMSILHVGYLRREDAKQKYDRYNGLPGHNPTHIRSILEPGQLEVWEGFVPFLLEEGDVDD